MVGLSFAGFWILYTYLIYPLILSAVVAVRGPVKIHRDLQHEPQVEILVAAHNEEQVIAAKIRNCLGLDYPRNKLRIQVVLDGCTDSTAGIVGQFRVPNLAVHTRVRQSGKNQAMNWAVTNSKADILVLSDANAIVSSDSVRKLVSFFADARVGVVSGNLTLRNPNDVDSGYAEMTYWRYEQFLRKLESDFSSALYANGSIFAIRRELYRAVDDDVSDDLIVALLARRQNRRVIVDPTVVSMELADEDSAAGFQRKVRLAQRAMTGLWRHRKLIRPFSGTLGFQLVSHKLSRWFVSVPLTIAFFCSLVAIDLPVARTFLVVQGCFYLCASVGCILESAIGRAGVFRLPYYFCWVNLAAMTGIFRFFCGTSVSIWEPHRFSATGTRLENISCDS
jgi:cellulose synthase/poly-beta-1,6-N-acetylglucosamine synthase-like glycosyltransferase